ncbi:hypothetical protein ABZ721_14535 [Streptomyces sp. NPDC006733]|uniref:hypothetical protein n=1 Tax=Streptomyces sp. NPDC006733 TaxID=3155460 RepID=UPI0033F73F22
MSVHEDEWSATTADYVVNTVRNPSGGYDPCARIAMFYTEQTGPYGVYSVDAAYDDRVIRSQPYDAEITVDADGTTQTVTVDERAVHRALSAGEPSPVGYWLGGQPYELLQTDESDEHDTPVRFTYLRAQTEAALLFHQVATGRTLIAICADAAGDRVAQAKTALYAAHTVLITSGC